MKVKLLAIILVTTSILAIMLAAASFAATEETNIICQECIEKTNSAPIPLLALIFGGIIIGVKSLSLKIKKAWNIMTK